MGGSVHRGPITTGKGCPLSTLSRVRRTALAVTAAALAAAGGVVVTGPAGALPAPTQASAAGTYIVILDTPPKPGSPSRTRRITAQQDDVLARAGDPEVHYRLTSALNGFVAQLDRDQVKQLRGDDAVALVERSTTQQLASVDSPDFLGAEDAWAELGGPDRAGRGVVVGVVDTGIWPENPSFATLPDSRRPAHLRDACESGEEWDESDCSSKVVAARSFVKGFGADNLAASELLSPRDVHGHGSHTAAIAAGNDGVRVRVEGQDFGEASGMAPAAQIAVYKACWTAPDPADDGCTTADAVAAVDQAVADGVDVISYSVSGPAGAVADSVERAFLNASAAGVFVAAAAGNRGPGAGTVAHASPWVTTVGASTHHSFDGAVVLDDGSSWEGAMVSETAVPSAEIVLAETAVAPGRSISAARLCESGSLSPDAVRGTIVVCDRGSIARVDKSATVSAAGGAGMVLANVRPDSVTADFHAVPTVHVDAAAADAIRRYVEETEDPTATLDPSATDGGDEPRVASFSSRGSADADVLKPDLTAPGVAVLSAVSPPSSFDRLWDLSSGTSMSAAHVAGIAAYVRGEHPDWTPAMLRSALTTTAQDLGGVTGPLAEGAGQVDAAAVLDPGLVLHAATPRFRAYLDGQLQAHALNLPSIALGDLTGSARVTRRVTNVSGTSETYTPQVTGLAGISTTVRPRVLRLGPGESGRFTVRFEVDDATLETPTRGQLVWTGLDHRAHLPVLLRPRAVTAPEEITGTTEEGSVTVPGVAGRDGALEVSLAGLASATPVGLTLEPGEFDPQHPADDLDTARFDVEVPGDTEVLRFELDGRDTDDLDLYLYRGDELMASASDELSDEVLTRERPEPGDYTLFVQSASAGNGSTTTAQLYTWVVRADDAGNVSAPAQVPVAAGEEFGVDLSWGDLDPTLRWFGAVRYDGTDVRTLITLD